MARATSLMLVVALAGTACGFGNWSDEDFVFERARPSRELVQLRVPGVDGAADGLASALAQGLNDSCANGAQSEALVCQTRNLAKLFNGVTFALLDLVQAITRNEPTRRAQGLRVWGPWYDASANRTFRFEMRRVDRADFRYCVHMAAGRKTGFRVDADVKCGRDVAGFVEVLGGTYQPDPEADDPRQALGTMDLNLNKQRDAGLNPFDRPREDGRFIFDYDTTGGQQTIRITVKDVTNQDTGLPSNAEYTYHRTASGSGRMDLALVNTDIRLSSLELHARWNDEGAARVDGVGVADGPFGRTYSGWECTNAALTILARHLDWAPELDLPRGNPDEGLCPLGLPPR